MDKQERKKMAAQARAAAQARQLEGVRLFPSPMEVLADPQLACVFRPALSVQKIIQGKKVLLHLLLSMGVDYEKRCEEAFCENGLWGFAYNAGRYQYLGSQAAFWDFEAIQVLYNRLQVDFAANKLQYLTEKLPVEAYCERLFDTVRVGLPQEKWDQIHCYLESFYGYEMVKTHYERTGELKSINALTRDWKSTDDFILSQADCKNGLEEFVINLEYNVKHHYPITMDMPCFGVDGSRFMNFKEMIIALADLERDRIYLLELNS